jgi:cytochrome c553
VSVARWLSLILALLAVLAFAVGFLWLPQVQADYARDGWWATICKAAGVPSVWTTALAGVDRRASQVEWSADLLRSGDSSDIGRGATLAMQCTMCHGARGLSASDAPNLAGQYPEVVYKQLRDYQGGQRSSALMEALARGLSEQDMRDLAAYYAYLPKPVLVSKARDLGVPPLIRVGDPMRNIAPCASCHGGYDQKFGSPWLEGMPQAYLTAQLRDFASGVRRNDAHGVMRNVARSMTEREIQSVARFYASREPTLQAAER